MRFTTLGPRPRGRGLRGNGGVRRGPLDAGRTDAEPEPTFSSIQTEIFDTTDSSGRLACISCHNAAAARLRPGSI